MIKLDLCMILADICWRWSIPGSFLMMINDDVDNDCEDVVEPVLSRPSSLNQGEGQHIHQNYRNKLKKER